MFVAMFGSMIVFTVLLCKKGLFAPNPDEFDQMVKNMDDVKQLREELTSFKDQLLKVEKVLSAKMAHMGLQDTLEHLNK
jgi:hypothetical protein